MENLDQFNAKIKNKIMKLKKLKIFFSNPNKAAIFLNKNYNEIDRWWNHQTKKKIYTDIKRSLYNETDKDTDNLLLKNLLNLKN